MSVHTKIDDFGKKMHLFDWKNRGSRPLEKAEKAVVGVFVAIVVVALLFVFALLL
ncbi:MAG: hypothetical protein BMS9Abin23_0893 [Thermodesulfobacteriota bacterium]|nr:MAG: hypothetical protein BMS9Abin23_0893 [Thermodesulfobacteriota bacterium]